MATLRTTRSPFLFAAAALLVTISASDARGETGQCPEGDRTGCATAAAPTPLPLHAHRIALHPYWAHSTGAVSHDALGAAVDAYLLERVAVGLDAALYAPFNGEPPAGSDRPTQVSAFVDLRGTFILVKGGAWIPDVYVSGGAGAIATRPVSTVDPVNRTFSYKSKLALDVGIGLRWFLTDMLVVGLEVHDTVFNEQLESVSIATGPRGEPRSPQDPTTWFGENRLAWRARTELGVTFLLPSL